MPHCKPEDFPNGSARWPAIGHEGFRTVHWGDMEVGYTTVSEPLDCTESYKFGGLPGGVCPCPHYGYIFEGRMRARYPGSDWPDEVIEAGEAYFIPSGHVLIYEEPSRVLELNPAHALGMVMDAMQRALIKAGETAETAPTGMSDTSTATTPGSSPPAVRDLDRLAGDMAGWLAGRLPDARGIRVFDMRYPLGAGMSHETILFDAAWQEAGEPRAQGMVVRIKPLRNTVYCDDMFEAQYRLMRLMHDSGKVRVARPLWFEDDDTLLGAPFFVMEKVAGRVAVSYPPYSKHGWLLDATPAERRRMWEDAVRQLASIQRVPTAQAGFLALPGRDGFDQEVSRWWRFIDWVDPKGGLALLRGTYDRLLAAGPVNRPEGIVWGDSRLGNMMIGSDFQVAAVMDWEQPSLGGALHDLGWWLYSDRAQTVAQGIMPLDGMGTRDETIALWREVSGKSAADIDWYEAYAGFKMECLAVRMTMIRDMPAQYRMREPGSTTAAFLDRS